MRNDYRNAKLHFQMTFSLPSTSCLRKLPADRRQTSYSNGQDSEVEEINQGLPGTNSAGGQYRT